VPQQKDHRVFREQFADLVAASGLSTRDIEKRSGVGRSTISDWKNGTALPNDAGQMATVAQVLIKATGDAVSQQSDGRQVQALMALLRDAKEERDARSSRPPGRPARQVSGLAAERRAQSAAAASDASKAFMSLRNLRTMPDWKREVASYSEARVPEMTAKEELVQAAWEQQRLDLLSEIELAALVIDDEQLRGRLKEAVQMLRLWDGPMRYARQPETRTRFIVAADVLEALGAYSRGEPLPARSPEYGDTKEFVDVYIEERELNSGR
jgi:transcriptional regulator with XRE-family HTH domain